MAKDGASIFHSNSGQAPAASHSKAQSPGGLLWCFGDLPPRPQIGIIRPVHRAHLCHANSGEIPLFESHLQRWNMFLSEHHSQAPPSVEQTLVSPAMWKRSPFGSLQGNIKRASTCSDLFHQSPSKPSTPVVKPVHSLRRSPATTPSTSDPPSAAQRSSCLPRPPRSPVEEPATL